MPLTQVPASMIATGGIPPFDGIKFPATQSASSDANTLDDYEEGTWTPNISSNNGVGTFVRKSGTYTKIGRLVTITFMVDSGNSLANGTTQYLTGLPFPVYNGYDINMIVGQLGSNGPANRTQQLMANPTWNAGVFYVYTGGSQETTAISYASGTATYLTNA